MAQMKISVTPFEDEKKSSTKKKKSSNGAKDSTATIGFEADFGPEHANTFRRDLHRNLRAAGVPATGKRRHA